MSGTYRAWNGKTYRWPPPDGWYRADDGRWWAPGSGPNPPGLIRRPLTDRPASAGSARRTPRGPAASTTGSDSGAAKRPKAVHHGRTPATSSTPSPATSGIAPTPPPTTKRRRSRITVVIAAVLLAGLTGGAIVGLVASTSDDDTAGSRIDASANSTTPRSTTTGSSDGSAATATGSSSTTAEGAPSASTSSATTTGTSSSSTLTSTIGEPGEPDEATGATASEPRVAEEQAEQVARFRELVTAGEVDADPLTDQDIADFADALCVIATVEDTTGFATARSQIATDQAAGSALSADQLSSSINAAIRAFCPADALRLGL